ncbi:MAG: MFS transporter [Lautropia sp.]
MSLPTAPSPIVRLLVALALITFGSSAIYVVVVVLPEIQREFGIARADASLPYTMTMIGFGIGGIFMGRMADRIGVMVPVLIGSVGMGAGYLVAAQATSLDTFAAAHGLLLGLIGSSALFSPLLADISLWFTKRRGIAVAICACGNYLAGAIWPPIVQPLMDSFGWRTAYNWLGLSCFVVMVPLSTLLRHRPAATPAIASPAAIEAAPSHDGRAIVLPKSQLQWLICIAGLACCVAMAMPQVHIVAYCADLGFGVARGAQMLALMLAFGIASRLLFGLICDRIGGVRTLLLGSILQGVSLVLYLGFDSLASLFLISAIFGLFQGGIVPSYAIIVRESFPPSEAGFRIALAMTATMLGMALGGWISGKIFDLTGSYQAAFINGIGWNLLNLAIATYLLWCTRGIRWPGQRPAVQ